MSAITRLRPDDRPRERALRLGLRALNDRELLATVLGCGARNAGVLDLAASLAASGGLDRLASSTPQELQQLPGLGPAQAVRLAAAFELGRRALAPRRRERALTTARALAAVAREELAGLGHEGVVVILLTAGLRLIRVVPVAQGGRCGAGLLVADVLAPAVREGAPRLALAHNHPGGDPRPSRADEEATTRIRSAAEVLGLDLVDHLIIGAGDRFTSLAAQGVLARA